MNSPLHLSPEQVWSLLLLDLQREQHLRKISSLIGLKIWLNSLLPRENIGYVRKGVNLWSKYCLRSEISFFFSTNIVSSVYLSIQLSILNQPAVYLYLDSSIYLLVYQPSGPYASRSETSFCFSANIVLRVFS